MKILFIAGVAFFCGVAGVRGASPDDQIKAFEEAVKAAPAEKVKPGSSIYPMGRALTVETFDLEVQRDGANELNIEQLAQQLMAAHPSDAVQSAGEDLIAQLESRRKTRIDAYTSEANAVLAKVPDAVTQAKKPSDLDEILKDLQTLQNPQGAVGYGYDGPPVLATKIMATFQFVTQWQDYLSALGSGNAERAQNSLRMILENRQLDAPHFFPRSEILARMVEAEGRKPADAAPGGEVMDPDVILAKITKPEELEPALPELARIAPPPGMRPWDWSGLMALAKARDDALAGFNVQLDLKLAMNGPIWGDNVSRIVAMELLVLLPHYFGTDVSDPPKEGETVNAYLDRLSASASAAGDLALLQRVLAVKVALGSPNGNFVAPSTQEFLAGLSQDAGGQYEPAVISYENALRNADDFLPVRIVGERLAAIKAAHPDDFQQGLTAFLAPPSPGPYGNFYNGVALRPPPQPGFPPGGRIPVLPIPMTLSIPSKVSPSAAPATNAPAVTPSSPAAR